MDSSRRRRPHYRLPHKPIQLRKIRPCTDFSWVRFFKLLIENLAKHICRGTSNESFIPPGSNLTFAQGLPFLWPNITPQNIEKISEVYPISTYETEDNALSNAAGEGMNRCTVRFIFLNLMAPINLMLYIDRPSRKIFQKCMGLPIQSANPRLYYWACRAFGWKLDVFQRNCVRTHLISVLVNRQLIGFFTIFIAPGMWLFILDGDHLLTQTKISSNATVTFHSLSPSEQVFSQQLISYWISFIRSDNASPNEYKSADAPVWPEYGSGTRLILGQSEGGGIHAEEIPADELHRCEVIFDQVEGLQD